MSQVLIFAFDILGSIEAIWHYGLRHDFTIGEKALRAELSNTGQFARRVLSCPLKLK
jgi:hypothetical protein